MFRQFLLMKAIPRKVDCGLLTLRLIAAIPLFLKHGTEKLFRFHHMLAFFPNPLHIGQVPSLLFATLSDGICTLLIIIGFATRWAALVCFINIFVALVFDAALSRGNDHADSRRGGEIQHRSIDE